MFSTGRFKTVSGRHGANVLGTHVVVYSSTGFQVLGLILGLVYSGSNLLVLVLVLMVNVLVTRNEYQPSTGLLFP